MHEGDARLKGFLNAQRHAFDTVDPEMARRRREQATENFHQSRFTGAILANEPDHFARTRRKAYAVQRNYTLKGFCDFDQLKKRRGHGLIVPLEGMALDLISSRGRGVEAILLQRPSCFDLTSRSLRPDQP